MQRKLSADAFAVNGVPSLRYQSKNNICRFTFHFEQKFYSFLHPNINLLVIVKAKTRSSTLRTNINVSLQHFKTDRMFHWHAVRISLLSLLIISSWRSNSCSSTKIHPIIILVHDFRIRNLRNSALKSNTRTTNSRLLSRTDWICYLLAWLYVVCEIWPVIGWGWYPAIPQMWKRSDKLSGLNFFTIFLHHWSNSTYFPGIVSEIELRPLRTNSPKTTLEENITLFKQTRPRLPW